MTTQSHFGGTVTDPVAYSVNVDAQKTSTGWELTLDNGRQLEVTTLDEAATRIRTLLDIYQPAVNHDTVTVTLAISPTAAPAKTAAPSVAGASRTSARASAASSTTGARTPSATSAAARTTTSSAAVTPAASRSATSSRTATATPSARTATSTQSTPVARPATTSRAPHTTTSPRTTTQSPTASTRFSTTSSATSTPASARPATASARPAATARPAAMGSTASASARPSATASARPADTARPAAATAASTRSASTRTTANPPATDYASVGPSGLECTLWLTAAKEKHPSFSDAAIEVFPWINTLPAEQRRRCLGDIHVGLKRATEEYAYSELRDTVSRWRKISAAPPVTPTAPHNEVRPTTSAPASPARSSFGNYPAAIHRISAAAATPAAASRPATSAASAPHGSQGSPIDLNPQGRHRL